MSAPKTIDAALEEWEGSLRSSRLSRNTIRLYTLTVRQLRDVVGNIYVRNLTPQHFDRYFSYYHTWNEKSVGVKLSHLKLFVEWCRAYGYIPPSKNPLGHRRAPKAPRMKRLRLTRNQFEQALDLAVEPRDRIIVAVLLYTLARDSEATSFRWEHFDRERGLVYTVRHKTKEDDDLPICLELDNELERWKQHLEQTTGPVQPEWYVLCPKKASREQAPNGQWRANSASGVYLPHNRLNTLTPLVKPVLTGLGYELQHDGAHTFRRSGARELFEYLSQEMNEAKALRIVQSMLGHSSMAQTEVYIGLERDRETRNQVIRGKSMYGLPTHAVLRGHAAMHRATVTALKEVKDVA